MAFWGIEVKPGKPFTHSTGKGRLHVSLATLGTGAASKKSIVQCNVGDKSPVFLCSLFPEIAETCQLNVEFEENDEVIFSVIGPRSVHLVGYYLQNGRCATLDDDELESYGEDIADTETEKSDHSDEDDYEDSFIDDDDDRAPSIDGIIEETPQKKKPKKGTKRLRRKYHVSESENDDSPEKQNFVTSSSPAKNLDTESEDNLLISSLCEGNSVSKSLALDEENAEKEEEMAHIKETTNKGYSLSLSERTDVAADVKHQSGLDAENDTDPQKKIKYQQDEATGSLCQDLQMKCEPNEKHVLDREEGSVPNNLKKLGKEENFPGSSCDDDGIACKDNAQKQGGELENMQQGLPQRNEQNETSENNDEGNVPLNLLQQTEVDLSEDDAKPKRKRKHRLEEKIPGDIVIKEGESQTTEANSDSSAKDLPVNKEQTEMHGNDKNFGSDADGIVVENHSGGRRKKKRTKNLENGDEMKFELPSLSVDIEANNIDGQSTQLRTLSNGLIIEEVETGKQDAQIATLGKKVSIRYTCKLKESGDVLDSNVGKVPLKIRLGKKEVENVWDLGLDGMQVGGKRRLIVPPSLDCRVKGVGKNIPPDSFVVFDVELIKLK
ncbi:hypothetical protein SLEP1_g34472 [Rubroshorea leprosula]|uniref:peptidylprolyl isomerase n=1 Tax=Rubroshorea leprosula TaxID=152421 RepID=A0AAV5KK63_9ROSI|nr:hypothetical protein SLEP1_g34472 [Rubroshorea leprosula]